MLNTLKKLCCIDGTSGREEKIREFIIGEISENPYYIDPLGNLIVEVKGRKKAKNKVMVCAHMDEVGVIATYITADGFIKFKTVGGIQPSVLIGRAVKFESGITGVIGIKPIHLCSPEEKTVLPKTENLYIDIGADSKEEAMKAVLPGDTAVFSCEYIESGKKILSKAIDDRAGCAVMLDMIKSGPEYDTVFAFTVQEEVGLRGAKTAAFNIAPDYAVVLEATTAADIIGVKDENRVCVLGSGAAVSFMDNATVYDYALYKKMLDIGKENNISVQPKTMVAGGNDAGSVHMSRGGVKTITLNVPCRYIHSASCVCDKDDILSLRAIAEKAVEYFANV